LEQMKQCREASGERAAAPPGSPGWGAAGDVTPALYRHATSAGSFCFLRGMRCCAAIIGSLSIVWRYCSSAVLLAETTDRLLKLQEVAGGLSELQEAANKARLLQRKAHIRAAAEEHKSAGAKRMVGSDDCWFGLVVYV